MKNQPAVPAAMLHSFDTRQIVGNLRVMASLYIFCSKNNTNNVFNYREVHSLFKDSAFDVEEFSNDSSPLEKCFWVLMVMQVIIKEI